MEGLQSKSGKLISAAGDVRYLLQKKYPRSGAVAFVGNHFQLTKAERDILYRGVYPPDEANRRRERLGPVDPIRGRPLAIDGHNVLITLESMILNRTLIDCDDGVIRDIAGVFRSYRPSSATDEALALLLDFLAEYRPESVDIVFVEPLGMSRDLARRVNRYMEERGIPGRARTSGNVAGELMAHPGWVGSGDSVTLDRAAHPFDPAGWIIRGMVKPSDLVKLREAE